jgi:hypothetical protein
MQSHDEVRQQKAGTSGCPTDKPASFVSNPDMAEHSKQFPLKRTMTFDRKTVSDEGAILAPDASLPVYIDRERMDRHLAGPRHALPAHANTSEEICSFLDSLAKDLK